MHRKTRRKVNDLERVELKKIPALQCNVHCSHRLQVELQEQQNLQFRNQWTEKVQLDVVEDAAWHPDAMQHLGATELAALQRQLVAA